MYEVEQKHRIEDLARLEKAFTKLGVTLSAPAVQADRYLNHPARDFAKTDEALRIRQVGETNCVTYKGPKLNQKNKTRREIEVLFAAGLEQAEQFAEIFLALGFKPVTTVRKARRSGKCKWEHREVLVAVDHVEELGDFVELELPAQESEIEAAGNVLASLAVHLSLGPSERRSYLELLLEKNR